MERIPAQTGKPEGLQIADGAQHRKHHLGGSAHRPGTEEYGQFHPGALFEIAGEVQQSPRDGELLQFGGELAAIFQPNYGCNGSANPRAWSPSWRLTLHKITHHTHPDSYGAQRDASIRLSATACRATAVVVQPTAGSSGTFFSSRIRTPFHRPDKSDNGDRSRQSVATRSD